MPGRKQAGGAKFLNVITAACFFSRQVIALNQERHILKPYHHSMYRILRKESVWRAFDNTACMFSDVFRHISAAIQYLNILSRENMNLSPDSAVHKRHTLHKCPALQQEVWLISFQRIADLFLCGFPIKWLFFPGRNSQAPFVENILMPVRHRQLFSAFAEGIP